MIKKWMEGWKEWKIIISYGSINDLVFGFDLKNK